MIAPFRWVPASLRMNRARLAISSIEPIRPVGVAARIMSPTLPGKSRRAPSVSPIGPGAMALTRMPCGPHSTARVAREGVDRRLGGGNVKLAGSAAVVQGRAYIQDLAPTLLELDLIRGPADIPGSLGINVDDGAKAVGAQVGRGAKEIAGRVVDHDVEPAQLHDRPVDSRLDRFGLPHVGDQRKTPCARWLR